MKIDENTKESRMIDMIDGLMHVEGKRARCTCDNDVKVTS